MTRAQRGCFAVRSHCALSVCLLCVCGQGANGWLRTQGSRCHLKLSHFLPFCLCSSTSIFDVAIPCWHSMCFLYLSVEPCFSCTLLFSWRSTEVYKDKWKLPTFCCMSSILVILPFWQGRHGRWDVIEVSLNFCLSGLAQWAVWAEVFLADSVPTCNAWHNLLGFASSHRNEQNPYNASCLSGSYTLH